MFFSLSLYSRLIQCIDIYIVNNTPLCFFRSFVSLIPLAKWNDRGSYIIKLMLSLLCVCLACWASLTGACHHVAVSYYIFPAAFINHSTFGFLVALYT